MSILTSIQTSLDSTKQNERVNSVHNESCTCRRILEFMFSILKILIHSTLL